MLKLNNNNISMNNFTDLFNINDVQFVESLLNI